MSEITTQPALEVHIPTSQPSKGEREYEAFLRLLPELLPAYRSKFVAIHEGKVVDSDTDDIALVQRVHARVGYVPIHVGLVSEQPVIVRVPQYSGYRPFGVRA